MKPLAFCAEIQYETDEGMIHSDICYGCEDGNPRIMSDESRQFYHDCLDEWLNNSGGTGAFYLGSVWNFIDKE